MAMRLGQLDNMIAPTVESTCTPRFVLVAFSNDKQPVSLLHRSVEHFKEVKCGRWCYSLRLLPMVSKDNFFCRIERLRVFLREQCDDSIVLHVDAYDTFLNAPASTMLSLFRQMRTGVVWAVESEYSWQDPANRSFYDALADGQGRYRYLNGGGYIGYARALRHVMENARYISKFKGADQMSFSRLFADSCADTPDGHCQTWLDYNVTLDYDSRIFYVASGKDWHYKTAKERISSARPSHVHVPWTAFAPNKRLLHKLFNESIPADASTTAPAIAATAADPSLEWWDLHRGRPFWTPANHSQVLADAEQHCHGGPWPEVVGRRSHHGGPTRMQP